MQAYSRESTAYDFSLFDTSLRKPVPEAEAKRKPELKVVQVSAAKRGNPALIVAVSVLFAAIIMMFVYSKAVLSEVNLNVGLKTQELENVQMINQELKTELDGSVTLDYVENYAATKLNMQKVVAAQENYVEMNTGAMTENAEETNGDVFVGMQNWFEDVKEYLGL